MFKFTDNEWLKKELKLFQVANNFDNITEICKKWVLYHKRIIIH